MERAERCSHGQSCLKKPPAKLSLILGMDLHHIAPKLVEQFSDKYGFMSVYACSLSQKLIMAGNRMFPYTEDTARSALSNTNSFGGATDSASDLEEDNLSSLPTTALLHSALQENCPTAVRLGQKSPALQFPEDVPNTHINIAASTILHNTAQYCTIRANTAASTASASTTRSSRTPSATATATATPSPPPPVGAATPPVRFGSAAPSVRFGSAATTAPTLTGSPPQPTTTTLAAAATVPHSIR